LEVLDESDSEEVAVIEVRDDSWNVGPADVGGGSESSFAGGEFEGLVGAWNASDGDRLEESGGSQAVLELFEFVGLEVFSWLEGVWFYGCDWNAAGCSGCGLAGVGGSGLMPSGGLNEGFESPAESAGGDFGLGSHVASGSCVVFSCRPRF
jgi:hypothetical protein